MADNERWGTEEVLSGYGAGGFRQSDPAPVPERGPIGFMQDTFLEALSGGVGVVRGIQGMRENVVRAIDPSAPEALGAKKQMDALADMDYWIRRGRTQTAQERDAMGGPSIWHEPVDVASRFLAGSLPYAPFAVAPIAGAAAMAPLAFGQQSSDARETIRNATPEQMAQNPKYQALIGQGLSDTEARERLYDETTDITSGEVLARQLPGVIGNVATVGGLGLMGRTFMKGRLFPERTPAPTGRVLGVGDDGRLMWSAGQPATKAALRKDTTDMVDRIMSKVDATRMGRTAASTAAGVGTGAMMGTGTNLTKQMNEVAAGLRTEIDWNEVAEEGALAGGMLGALGAGAGALSRRAPPVGTDTEAVARLQAMHGDRGVGEFGPRLPEGPWNQPRLEIPEIDFGGGPGGPGGSGAPPPPVGPTPGPTPQPRPPRPGAFTPGTPGVLGTDTVGPAGGPPVLGPVPRMGDFEPAAREPLPPGWTGPEPVRGPVAPPWVAPQVPEHYAAAAHPGYTVPPVGGRGLASEQMTQPTAVPAQPPGRRERVFTEEGEAVRPLRTQPEHVPAMQYEGEVAWPMAAVAEHEAPVPTPTRRRGRPAKEQAAEVVEQEPLGIVEQTTGFKVEGGYEALTHQERGSIGRILANKSVETRRAWADRLQKAYETKGEVSLADLPKIGQLMIKETGPINRALQRNPVEAIEAIRGIGPSATLREFNALENRLKNVGAEQRTAWADRLQKILDKKGRLETADINQPLRDVMGPSVLERFQTAIQKHPQEAVDRVRGTTRPPEPSRIEAARPGEKPKVELPPLTPRQQAHTKWFEGKVEGEPNPVAGTTRLYRVERGARVSPWFDDAEEAGRHADKLLAGGKAPEGLLRVRYVDLPTERATRLRREDSRFTLPHEDYLSSRVVGERPAEPAKTVTEAEVRTDPVFDALADRVVEELVLPEPTPMAELEKQAHEIALLRVNRHRGSVSRDEYRRLYDDAYRDALELVQKNDLERRQAAAEPMSQERLREQADFYADQVVQRMRRRFPDRARDSEQVEFWRRAAFNRAMAALQAREQEKTRFAEQARRGEAPVERRQIIGPRPTAFPKAEVRTHVPGENLPPEVLQRAYGATEPGPLRTALLQALEMYEEKGLLSEAMARLLQHMVQTHPEGARIVPIWQWAHEQAAQQRVDERSRMHRRRDRLYKMRDRVSEKLMGDYGPLHRALEAVVGSEKMTDMLGKLKKNQLSSRDLLDEVYKGIGMQRGEGEARLPMTEIERNRLFAAAEGVIQAAQARIDAANAELERRKQRLPRDSTLIGWRVGTRRSNEAIRGKYPWFDRLTDTLIQQRRIKAALEVGRKRAAGSEEVTVEPTRREGEQGRRRTRLTRSFDPYALQNYITQFWHREAMILDGRVEQWEQDAREESTFTYDATLQKIQGYINSRDAAARALSRTQPGSMQEAVAQRTLDRWNRAIDNERKTLEALEGMFDRDTEQAMREVEWDRDTAETQTMLQMALDRWEEYQGQLKAEVDAEAERQRQIKEQEEKAKEAEAKLVTAEVIEFKPRTSEETDRRRQQRERLNEIEQRMEQINDAVDALPDDPRYYTTATLHRLREQLGIRWDHERAVEELGKDPAPLIEQHKLDVDAEARLLDNEARRIAFETDPKLLREEIGIRRVLDPTSDLRHGNTLPEGASVLRVSDLLQSTAETIRPESEQLERPLLSDQQVAAVAALRRTAVGSQQSVGRRAEVSLSRRDRLRRLMAHAWGDRISQTLNERRSRGDYTFTPNDLPPTLRDMTVHDTDFLAALARNPRAVANVLQGRNQRDTVSLGAELASMQRRHPGDDVLMTDARGRTERMVGDIGATMEHARQHFFDLVNRLIGHKDVVILTDEQMKLAAEARGLAPDTPAFYDARADRIFVSQTTNRSSQRGSILSHEFVHPLTDLALQYFPEYFRYFDTIRQALRDQYFKGSTGLETGPSEAVFDRALTTAQILRGRTQGLTNVHEFLSELWAYDSPLPQALALVKTSSIPGYKQARTGNLLNDALSFIKDGLRRLFRIASPKSALNDAVIASFRMLQEVEPYVRAGAKPRFDTPPRPFSFTDAVDYVADKGHNLRVHLGDIAKGGGVMLNWMDINEMGRLGDPGMQERVVPFESLINRTIATARKIMHDSGTWEIAKHIGDVARMNSTKFDELQRYIEMENMHQMSGSDPLFEGRNAHISRDSLADSQKRDNHAALKALWDDLPAEHKALRNRLLDFYDKRHKRMIYATVDRLLELRDIVPGHDAVATRAVAKHIVGDALTAQDRMALARVPGYEEEPDLGDKSPEKVKFRAAVRDIRAIEQLRTLEGPWYPMMRRGKWVVEGLYNLAKHAKAVAEDADEKSRGEWEFATAEQRQDFMNRLQTDPNMKGVKLLGTSEVHYGPGGEIATTGYAERRKRIAGERGVPGYEAELKGAERRLTRRQAEEAEDVTTRYRVKYNPLLLEFHERRGEAERRHTELRGDPDLQMAHVMPQKDQHGRFLSPNHADQALHNMLTSVKRGDVWGRLDATSQRQFERDLEEGVVRNLLSTSARSTYLPRRYAQGARKDIMRDFMEYSKNTGLTLAELEHRTESRRLLKEMDDYVRDYRMQNAPGDPQGKYGTLREQIRNQIHKQLTERPEDLVFPWANKAIERLLQLSYLDKLMSPGFWVVNSTEPWLLGAPLMAGEHGLRTYGYLVSAYRALGFAGMWGQGFKDAGSVVKRGLPGADPLVIDNVGYLKDRVRAQRDGTRLGQLFEFLEQEGYINRDAGMELEQTFNPQAGALLRGLDWMDNATRQINIQIENVNRGVMGIAAYRLAVDKGQSHEQAMQYAKKILHDAAGNMSLYTAPAAFRHPLARPALQFKRYAQRLVANYVRMLAGTIRGTRDLVTGRHVDPEDAMRARQLGFVVGSIVAASGAEGLPTEPLQAVVWGLNKAGVIDWNWTNVLDFERRALAESLGPELGYFLSRGGFRMAGLGLGTRVGHNSMVSSGQLGPPESAMAQFGTLVAGPPGAYMMDIGEAAGHAISSIRNFAKGNTTQGREDVLEAFKLGFPSKLVADSLSATSTYLGGPGSRTPSGQRLFQPDFGDVALQTIGIRSARSQSFAEARQVTYNRKTQYENRRKDLMTKFAKAETRAEQQLIWREVQTDFNRTVPPELRLSYSQLVAALDRRKERAKMPLDLYGVPLTPRQRGFAPSPEVYPFQ